MLRNRIGNHTLRGTVFIKRYVEQLRLPWGL